MGLFGRKESQLPVGWVLLTDLAQLDEAIEKSHESPVLLFKHSTKCSISSMAFNRLKSEWEECDITPYYLDLITYRPISNEIEARLNVTHQSPQAILLKNGEVVYHASHSAIDFKSVFENV